MKEKQNRIKLYFSVLIVNLVYFSCGCLAGWSSPSLPKLQSQESWFHITDAESAWIVSFFPVGGIFGPIISGLLLDSIGRRATILFNILLILVSWILLAIATSIYIMYIARFIAGFGAGITFAIVPIYIAEIAENDIRSAVNTVMPFSVSSAILLVYSIGPYISYLQLIIVSIVPSIIFLILYPWLPESPYYLVYKNDKNKAVSNLRWFRGNISELCIEQEIKDIQLAVADRSSQKGTIKDIFTSVAGRKATFIVWGLFFWLQMSGVSVITFYTEPIFKLTGSSISSSVSAIIFGVCNVIVGAVSPPLINHFGYKRSLIVSSVLMFFTHSVMGIFLFMAVRNYNVQSFSWLPVVMLSGYIVAAGIGFSPIPWALLGELYPTHVKAIGAGISTCFSSACASITSNIFPDLVNLLGIDYVFVLYGLCCLFATFFIIFLVPDTSGLSLVEIQELMNNPKSLKPERETRDQILMDRV